MRVYVPSFGIELSHVPNDKSGIKTVKEALGSGYRLFDVSNNKNNLCLLDKALSQAFRKNIFSKATISRKEIFVTSCIKANDILKGESFLIEKINLFFKYQSIGYIDLLLMDTLSDPTLALNAWKLFEKIKLGEKNINGSIKNIGILNHTKDEILTILSECREKPMVHKFSLSPYYPNRMMVNICEKNKLKVMAKIVPEINNKIVRSIGEYHKVSNEQVIIRWAVQQGYATVVEAHDANKIKNYSHLNFCLSPQDFCYLEKLRAH